MTKAEGGRPRLGGATIVGRGSFATVVCDDMEAMVKALSQQRLFRVSADFVGPT